MMSHFTRIISGLACLLWLVMSIAHAQSVDEVQTSPHITRVGGDFLVKKIETLQDGSFRIVFDHADSTRHKTLVLVSDHVHMGVEEGQTLRLSAEILAEHEKYTEVSQVLLFLSSEYGKTPVWMLSQKQPHLSLGGVKLLEMHAPSADYAIF
ncbi:MAG: hypothetical protein ACOH5I_05025 [Oligoflexus sp.]